MAETSSTEKITPQSLITEENVKKALAEDKGNDALLRSWKVVDFTKKGDNYACVVTSVEVKYSIKNEEHDVSYVVKINSLISFPGIPDLSSTIFPKEARFYQEALPALSKVLVSAGQPPLRMPKCLFAFLEDGKQQLYFEDLRAKGYKMFDRRKGMDKEHTSLVLSELARLHSASYILMDQFSKESATSRFDFLSFELLDLSNEAGPLMKGMFENGIDTSKTMLEKTGGYEIAIAYLELLKSDLENLFPAKMKSEKFNSINHGDCWNNNILFRYDDLGHPLEVMLVDLQICREASLASDLNYFLFSSLTGEVRKKNFDHFMSLYYSNYKAVLEGAGQPMFFSEDELIKEFRDKNKLGLIFGMSFIPALLMEPDEVPDFANTDLEKLKQDFAEKSMMKFDTSPLYKPRFLSVFDELIESGLIS